MPGDHLAALPDWETPRERRRWVRRAALGVLVLVGFVAAGWIARGGIGDVAEGGLPVEKTPTREDAAPPPIADRPSPSPPAEDAPRAWADTATFAGPTGTTLLFDAGSDRVLAVDLDAGAFASRSLEGQRPGDQPYRLWRTGDAVIVGWERIYAVSIPTAESRLLGEATIFIPAAEPGHVWLIDYVSGRVEQGVAATYRLVNLTGEVRHEAPGIESYFPAHGVLGGLAIETEAGVAIWDPEDEEVITRLGGGAGFVADARDRTVVWCQDECAQLHMTDLHGNDQVFRPPPGTGAVFHARSARLSPDGRLVAAIVEDAGPLHDDSTGAVVVLDTETGQVTPITLPLLPPPAYLAWTQDGSQLFFSGYSYGASETNVGRYVPADELVELATLPIGGALSFVPLDREESEVFLEAARALPGRTAAQKEEDIPVPGVQGLTLAEAQAALDAAGLTGLPVSESGWADPDEPGAVVVAQNPPPGTLVAPGDVVGFRTALITAELCSVLRQVPPRQGDAHDLAITDGYWDRLREAQPIADPHLAGHIEQLLAHHDNGGAVEDAPPRALDSITIHHDACSKGM